MDFHVQQRTHFVAEHLTDMRGATLFSVVSSLDIITPTLFCEKQTVHEP
jgi:hypothetical protein